MTYEQLKQSKELQSRQGSHGEQFALAFERKRLPGFLHDKIVCFEEKQIAMGYDILSFETATSILPDRYIEVKTFRGHPHFYWSENEIAAAKRYADHYYLYLINIERVVDADYEPQIIPNPSVLFNDGNQWACQVQQYVFTLKANSCIPSDWDASTILLGCYNNDKHLEWILSHRHYNVRAEKDFPGAVTLSNSQVRQAKYLILYSVSNPRVYMLYSLEPSPYKATKTEMLAQGYPNPHAFSYILHPIRERLNTFYINLPSLLREINHQGDNTYGTPLYLTGIQLHGFMTEFEECENSNMPALESQGETNRPSKRGALWTQADDSQLIAHLQSHASIEVIAPLMKRTEKAIARRMSRLRKAGIISFDLYMHYQNTDPAFTSYLRFKR